MLVFEERVKPKYREKILLQQIEEPTTNSTHMWRPSWDSTPGHTGGKRVLSPLHHPCTNKTKTMVCWIFPFFNSEKNYIFSLFQQKQTTMNKDWHTWLLRGLTCERSRVWVTDVTSNLYQSLSLPKWTKYNIYVRINLLSDIILLDDEVVPTSPVCSSKNFLSNLECTLWKSEENSQVRQKRQRHKVK